jgi:hypothetical protein
VVAEVCFVDLVGGMPAELAYGGVVGGHAYGVLGVDVDGKCVELHVVIGAEDEQVG